MSSGKVKWFNNKKGYGFISPNAGDDDVFVHYSNITMDGVRILEQDQELMYNTKDGQKGLEAIDVIIVANGNK